jgi:hypothetical protein
MCTAFFNIQQPCILFTMCIYRVSVILRINIDYFPERHEKVDLCNGDALYFVCCETF